MCLFIHEEKNQKLSISESSCFNESLLLGLGTLTTCYLLRQCWHLFQIVRLVLLTIGMSCRVGIAHPTDNLSIDNDRAYWFSTAG